jgi:hypothetical protein
MTEDVRMQPVPFQTPTSLLQRLFWLVPTIAVFSSPNLTTSVAAASCTASALAWQLVYRRDLADRLTRLAALIIPVTLVMVGLDVFGDIGSWSTGDADAMGGLLWVILTLVLVEQLLRLRDQRWRDREESELRQPSTARRG